MYLMITGLLGHSAIAVDITKVHLASSSKHTIGLAEHSMLVWTQVDHAVADDNVDRVILYARLVQELHVTLHKTHVALLVAQLLSTES